MTQKLQWIWGVSLDWYIHEVIENGYKSCRHYDGSEACRHANINLDVFRTIVCAVLRFCELSILLARHKVAMEYQLIFRKTYDVTNHAHQSTAYARMSIPLQILLSVGARVS
jgi:hypothetical protein